MNSETGPSTGGIGRRDLIKTAALGAAALATGAAPARAKAPMERIGIGFIGVGGRGSALFGDILQRAKDPAAGIEIVAVCDVWDRRADDRIRDAGGSPKRYRDYRELLANKSVDAVVIATPDHWHSMQAIDAMRAGKDVYCEKPLTLYWNQAKDVARVSRETGKLVQCGAGSGSDGTWWTIRDAVKQGGIGPVVWFQGGAFRNDPGGDWNWPIQPCKPGVDLDWDMWLGHRFGRAPKRPYDSERYSRFRKYWDYSGGLATDLLYHVYAHLAIAIDHELPFRVAATGVQPVHNHKNDNREVPTLFTVSADYRSQCSCLMVGTQECEDGLGDMVRGQKGVIVPIGDGFAVRPQNAFRSEMLDIAHKLPCYEKARLVTHKDGDRTVLDEIQVPRKYNYDHMGNWLECLRTRKQPTLNAELAYRVMVPIGLSVISFRQGRTVFFDPDRQMVVDRNPMPI